MKKRGYIRWREPPACKMCVCMKLVNLAPEKFNNEVELNVAMVF